MCVEVEWLELLLMVVVVVTKGGEYQYYNSSIMINMLGGGWWCWGESFVEGGCLRLVKEIQLLLNCYSTRGSMDFCCKNTGLE